MKSLESFYQNKNVVITGGTSGIGLALAEKLSALGANITIIARRKELLDAAIEKLEHASVSQDQRFTSLIGDISNQESISATLNDYISKNSPTDILINCAGVAHPGRFEALDIDIFHWMINVNYLGTVYVTKQFIPGMIARHSGTVVNISSLAGLLGVYGYTAYGASKYAVRGFSDVLRAEMKPQGIGVSIVFPPDTDTPQLAYESQYKPPVTKIIAGNAGGLSAEKVANAALKGIAQGKYIITPGIEGSLIYRFTNLFGRLIYPIMDLMVEDAIKKTNTK